MKELEYEQVQVVATDIRWSAKNGLHMNHFISIRSDSSIKEIEMLSQIIVIDEIWARLYDLEIKMQSN